MIQRSSLREWLSFLLDPKCFARLSIRLERRAICTSGEPVSPCLTENSSIIFCLFLFDSPLVTFCGISFSTLVTNFFVGVFFAAVFGFIFFGSLDPCPPSLRLGAGRRVWIFGSFFVFLFAII